ncbi:hypothetical protein HYU40_03280 [Candidatus Woesearchaeota archaeon]|nr:hypothetical protein [Candidatus Woesearchaeota archaeon]
MLVTNSSIDDFLDKTVVNYYPEYAEAANIAGIIEDLSIGTAAYLSTYGQKQGNRFVWNPAVTEEFYGTAITEALELSALVKLVRSSIKSASDKARAIIRSHFSEELKSYYGCIDLLIHFLSSDPEFIATKAQS